MSVVIAVREKGVVYMGCDTQTTIGDRKVNGLDKFNYKIIKLSNGILLGVCGKVITAQHIADANIFDIGDKPFNKATIVNCIVPKLRDSLKCGQYKGENGEMTVSLLVAYGDKVYKICKDYAVLNVPDFYGIGSGGEFAYGVLSTLSNLSVEERVIKALKTSGKFDSYVSGPYVLINTKDNEYKVVEG